MAFTGAVGVPVQGTMVGSGDVKKSVAPPGSTGFSGDMKPVFGSR